ncbi:hypothetical protein C9374_001608 [Naegleria lovaniensis]|uniref:Knr4/Smi1-like domain-containing protein n=1 Tax=Naegleria lovaniensis TaxID=51637 RepID=A0AA88GWM8_NAELO|nr:uncharacterized protein C9374_001608 [Naegleria lovaniensis]KAG2387276.1 hypothetical protein C9374_001608 [Naegleria lovaniensis]
MSQQHDHTISSEWMDHSLTTPLLVQLPHEMMELIFDYLNISEGCNTMRLLNRTISSQFLHYFRRILRERWEDENMVSLYPLNEPPVSPEMISQTEKKFKIIIPFVLKELLMITNGSRKPNRFHLLPIENWYERGYGVVFAKDYVIVSDGTSSHILVHDYDEFYSWTNFWNVLFHSDLSTSSVDVKKLPEKKYFEYNGFDWYDMREVHLKTIPKFYLNFLQCMVDPKRSELRYNAQTVIDCLNSEFLQDEKFACRVASLYYKLVRHFPSHLLDDKSYCKKLVTVQGKVLKYCPKFAIDREIVLAAVKSNGFALKYAPTFQSDSEIVSVALNTSPHVLHHVSKLTPNYKQYVLEALRKNKFDTVPKFFTEPMAQSKDYVEALLEKSPKLLKLMPKVWFNTQFFLKLMKKNSKCCKYILQQTTSLDKRVIKAALQLEPGSFIYLSEKHQRDRELLNLAFGCNISMNSENNTISKEGLKQILKAIEKAPKLLRVVCFKHDYLPLPMEDQELVMDFLQQACQKSLSQNGSLLRHCLGHDSLLDTNQQLQLLAAETACRQNPECLQHVYCEYTELFPQLLELESTAHCKDAPYFGYHYEPKDKAALMKNIRATQIAIIKRNNP